MSKVKIIFLLFVVLELVLLFEIGSAVGVLPVVLWVILMMLVGANVIARALRQAQNPFTLDPISLIVRLLAGVLLICPGFISDVLALLLLLLPGFRSFAGNQVSHSNIIHHATFGRFFGSKFHFTQENMDNPGFGSNEQDNAPYGQPSRPEQPKSDLQKAREHFQSKRPVIDAEYESVPDEDDKAQQDANDPKK